MLEWVNELLSSLTNKRMPLRINYKKKKYIYIRGK